MKVRHSNTLSDWDQRCFTSSGIHDLGACTLKRNFQRLPYEVVQHLVQLLHMVDQLVVDIVSDMRK